MLWRYIIFPLLQKTKRNPLRPFAVFRWTCQVIEQIYGHCLSVLMTKSSLPHPAVGTFRDPFIVCLTLIRITENMEHEDYCMYPNDGLRICNLQHILTRGSPRQSLTFCSATCHNLLFQIAIGTKSGEILIYDISSSSLIETVKAHSSTVWSLHVRADQCALVSGSEDKNVKFWEFEQRDASGENVCPFYFCEALQSDTPLGPKREIVNTRAYSDA
jgi:hypothetical protein